MAAQTLASSSFFSPAFPRRRNTIKQSETGSLTASSRQLSNLSLLKNYPLPPQNTVKFVQPQDRKTPDSHVERDPRLIRLTGVHPLNAEPPLADLYNQGFLTNDNLHFVRNHGQVPVCSDQDISTWTISIEGLVQHPFTLTVRELINGFKQVTYPVTLVCAGNRRKEQNIVRKTKGFSWGPAALSTALWTGVALGDLLAKAGPLRGARYVCFEGADHSPHGCYGTSIKLSWCLRADMGVMVAHKMNNSALHPDHGKPVRIIVPGQVAGRSVKWLKKIIVTKEPSDNWYHIYDNRVLPTMITPEASSHIPETWKDERYAIYDLNTNSVICHPQHDEVVLLDGSDQTYKVRGYAYSGGGKRVTRLEVTLDGGKSWRLASIEYPEDLYRDAPDGDELYGGKMDMWWRDTCFCWIFWEIDIPLAQLAGASDIMARAMDDSMMAQPKDMYWSVLGMLNNSWYRLVIHKEGCLIRFEHPTQSALMPGGWMERVKNAGGDIANGFGTSEKMVVRQDISMKNAQVKRVITMAELAQHSDEAEPWFVVDGEVYDATPYLQEHPGGATSIFAVAAQDCSQEFLAIHSENARAMMPNCHIGTLDAKSQAKLAAKAVSAEKNTARAVFLQSKEWNKALLKCKVKISPDTKIFRFSLDHKEQKLGLPVGQHVLMRFQDAASQEVIIRPYTPVSPRDATGTMDFVIKIYNTSTSGPGGRMTQALDSISVGQSVDLRGPVGKFEYEGDGKCRVSGHRRHVNRLVMICAGSGVTSVLTVLRAVFDGEEDKTECLVLNGNRSEEDILCRRELEGLIARGGGRAKLVHTLSKPLFCWKGRRGRMDGAFLAEYAARRGGQEALVLVCGPKGLEVAVKRVLMGMGWDKKEIVCF